MFEMYRGKGSMMWRTVRIREMFGRISREKHVAFTVTANICLICKRGRVTDKIRGLHGQGKCRVFGRSFKNYKISLRNVLELLNDKNDSEKHLHVENPVTKRTISSFRYRGIVGIVSHEQKNKTQRIISILDFISSIFNNKMKPKVKQISWHKN